MLDETQRRGLNLLTAGFLLVFLSGSVFVQGASESSRALRASVEQAAERAKDAIVRIEVVSTDYREGREYKFVGSGSGAIITPEGHVITNHHVAGKATRLVCTLANREKIDAEIVGKDPLTDIAVIKLTPDTPREFPTVPFGDSSMVRVGDTVLALGSPMSLSQSVTMGIVSNTEMVMPDWVKRWGRFEQDGEDVGSLVRWIGHDAQIYGGNSGGPLVNLQGEIIGINEISIGGLGGAIPGNLAESVAKALIKNGSVPRAWLGIEIQPRLRHSEITRGALIGGVLNHSPAKEADVKPGDVLLRLDGKEVDVQFTEQLPEINQFIADLPTGKPVEAVVQRDGREITLTLTPVDRERALTDEHELKQWGITARDISLIIALEMKRESREGVQVTTVRTGGPAGDAKPRIEGRDIIVEVAGKPVKNLSDLRAITEEVTEGKTEPTPVLVTFERGEERYLTVVKVGIKEMEDPGLEVRRAWLPVSTQVLTRDIAGHLQKPDLTGFRITRVFKESTAEKAGLQVGDYILAVDGEKLTASAPEDYDDLPQLIRQYPIGTTVELSILRSGEPKTVSVELAESPKLSREMKRYRDKDFEFTVRDITFFDKADKKWDLDQQGVVVETVDQGGWASVGQLMAGDLLLQIGDRTTSDVSVVESTMKGLSESKPRAVVFKVLRGIYTVFLEIEPQWDFNNSTQGKD